MTVSDELTELRAAVAGRYAIEGELGQGGMAMVYLARDLRHDRRVALKTLRRDLSAALATARFHREIQIAASLTHPHILPVHDSGEANGRLYYVMPYVAGESLRVRLLREGSVPFAAALEIVREVAGALDYAHRQGIVHRDIKPENILLVEGHACVADFGIARAVSAAGGDSLTDAGVAVGTPRYMSPEQARGSQNIDGRTDVFSLGCVLYEMLVGRPPTVWTDRTDARLGRLTNTPPEDRTAVSMLPQRVRQALARALAERPADRFGTAREFAAALEDPAAGRGTRGRVWRAAAVAVVLLVPVAGLALWRGGDWNRAPAGGGRVSLVVLPFQNLGPAEDDYFADGVTDEITARLASVQELGVIARQSAIRYKGSHKTVQEIADELGVAYVLEATVSWQRAPGGASRVRIRPQLIRTAEGTHVWAATYTEDLGDVFAVQAAIAEQVATAMHVTLVAGERRSLEGRPTENLDAYLAYLRGNEHYSRGWSEIANLREALPHVERAVQLDPRFALAHAKTSMVYSEMYFAGFDLDGELLARSREAAERALALQPMLPEARLALGLYYYRAERQYERALHELGIALERQPSNVDVLEAVAYVQRRQGRWEEAVANLEKATLLDPRGAHRHAGLAATYQMMRRFGDAARVLKRYVELSPAEGLPALAWQHLSRDGDTAAARRVIEDARGVADQRLIAELELALDYFAGHYDRALHRVAPGSRVTFGEVVAHVAPASDTAAYHVAQGELLRLSKRFSASRAHYDSARVLLEARVQEHPGQVRLHSALAVAYAGLGRSEEAVLEGRRAAELLPVTIDAAAGTDPLRVLAVTYVFAGRLEEALDLIEYLLSVPADFAPALLRLDPVWEPLREQPRFRRLAGQR